MVYTTYKRGDYLELASVSVVCKAWLGAWRKYSRGFVLCFINSNCRDSSCLCHLHDLFEENIVRSRKGTPSRMHLGDWVTRQILYLDLLASRLWYIAVNPSRNLMRGWACFNYTRFTGL